VADALADTTVAGPGRAGGTVAARSEARLTVPKPLSRWGWTAVWIALSVLTLLPVYWLAIVALRRRVDLMGNYTMLPTSISLENIRAVVTSDTFVRYLTNSVIVASANAVLSTTVAIGAAYALSRFRLAGRDNIFFWLLTNRMAPAAAFLLPVYLLFTRVFTFGDWSLLDTRLGLILLYTVFNVPFAVWMLQGMMEGIPEELDEAAFVDGAGSLRVLWSVILPILKPGLAVTVIFTWIFAWNEFLFASRLTNVDARTIPTALSEYVGVTGTNWGELAALALVTMAPGAVLVAFLQRHIIAGLTAGAVK
jgi:multiple sugar transport system permease protein